MPMIPNKFFLGIDAGVSGGLACVRKEGNVWSLLSTKHVTMTDVWEWILPLAPSRDATGRILVESFAAIEANSGYQREGRPGSRMFQFGVSTGVLKGFLIAAGIPFEEVSPQKWQKEFGMKKAKGEGDTSWKNRLKAKAQQLFPDAEITKATADALLIAEYARRLKTRRG